MPTSRQIAIEVMRYSEEHENDALMAPEPGGDMKYIGWEIPSYCQTIDELECEIFEAGYKTVDQAIKEMSDGFQRYHEYRQEIINS